MLLQKTKTEFPLNNFFGNFLFQDPESHSPFFRHELRTFPAVNIKEDDKGFTIELAVPGKKKEDFKIDLHEDVLTISAENKETKEEKTEKFTRKEYNYAAFKRSFTLPETADQEAISASYTDGILAVMVPKKEIKKPEVKTITIS